MKIFSKLSQATRLLLLTCTALASCFLALGTATGQSDNNTLPSSSSASNTLVITTPNSYTGRVIIDSGVLKLANHSVLKNANIFLGPNGTLDLGGTTQTISSPILEDGSKIINGTFLIDDEKSSYPMIGTPSLNNSFPIQDYLDFYKVSLQDGIFDLEGSEHLIPSLNFNNGGQIINGTLIIDSTATNNAWIDQSIQPPVF